MRDQTRGGSVAPGVPELAAVDLTDLDLFAGGFPDDVFTRLRAEAPVWWHPSSPHTPDGIGFWVLSSTTPSWPRCPTPPSSRRSGLRGRPGAGPSSRTSPTGTASGVLLNMMDDPRHHRIRRLVTPAVAPRALARMEDEMRSRSRVIVDGIAGRRSCDFLTEVAVELPLQAVAVADGGAGRRPGRPDGLVERHPRPTRAGNSGSTTRRWRRPRRRWRRTGTG